MNEERIFSVIVIGVISLIALYALTRILPRPPKISPAKEPGGEKTMRRLFSIKRVNRAIMLFNRYPVVFLCLVIAFIVAYSIEPRVDSEPTTHATGMIERYGFLEWPENPKLKKTLENARPETFARLHARSTIGSWRDRGDLDAFHKRVRDFCDRKECVENIKAAKLLVDLTDHPEIMDVNYFVTQAVGEVGFCNPAGEASNHGVQGNVARASEKLTLYLKMDRENGWHGDDDDAKAKRRLVLKIGPGFERRSPKECAKKLRIFLNGKSIHRRDWSLLCFKTRAEKCNNFIMIIEVPEEKIVRNSVSLTSLDGKTPLKADLKVEVAVLDIDQPRTFSQLAFETNRFDFGVGELKIILRSTSKLEDSVWAKYKADDLRRKGSPPLSSISVLKKAEPVEKEEKWPLNVPDATPCIYRWRYEFTSHSEILTDPIILWPAFISPPEPVR